MPLAIIGVFGLLLLVAGGVEADHLMHEYPGQFWFAVTSVLATATASAVARFRYASRGGRPVNLVREVAPPPLPKAIPASPVREAITSSVPSAQEAAPCEGPLCTRKVNDSPWTAEVPGDPREHVFCSEACASRWDQMRLKPSRS